MTKPTHLDRALVNPRHLYAGQCPDVNQPDALDPSCDACRLLMELAALRAVAEAADEFYRWCESTHAKVPYLKGIALGRALNTLDALTQEEKKS